MDINKVNGRDAARAEALRLRQDIAEIAVIVSAMQGIATLRRGRKANRKPYTSPAIEHTEDFVDALKKKAAEDAETER